MLASNDRRESSRVVRTFWVKAHDWRCHPSRWVAWDGEAADVTKKVGRKVEHAGIVLSCKVGRTAHCGARRPLDVREVNLYVYTSRTAMLR